MQRGKGETSKLTCIQKWAGTRTEEGLGLEGVLGVTVHPQRLVVSGGVHKEACRGGRCPTPNCHHPVGEEDNFGGYAVIFLIAKNKIQNRICVLRDN